VRALKIRVEKKQCRHKTANDKKQDSVVLVILEIWGVRDIHWGIWWRL